MEGTNELSSSDSDSDSSFEEDSDSDSDSELEYDSDVESAPEDASLTLAVAREELSDVDNSLLTGIFANNVAAVQRALRKGANVNRLCFATRGADCASTPLCVNLRK